MKNLPANGVFAKLARTALLTVAATGMLFGMPADSYAAKKPAATTSYTYYSVGDTALVPSLASPSYPSYVLMGGGPDVDEGFRWMIKRAGITPGSGGRIVVIRATGDGAYNPYIYYSGRKNSTSNLIQDGWVGGKSLGVSSVETLVIPSRDAASTEFVNKVVAGANAVWIAGGDQTNYFRYWKGTPLEETLKGLLAKNIPIGGTSAGLAVMGGFDFTGANGTVTSAQALDDPYNTYMQFDPTPLSTAGSFLTPPVFANTIMDSHLDSRDRMGRLITFVSRLIGPYSGTSTQQFGCPGGPITKASARGIGIGVETALVVNQNPDSSYTGERLTNVSTTTESAVYLVEITQGPTECASGKPLTVPQNSINIRKLDKAMPRINNIADWTGFPIYKTGGVFSGALSPANPY
jgi:cyanophycinase-like exopeptidase